MGANTPNIRFQGFTDDWEQRKLGEICERVVRKNKNNESDLPLTIASQYGLIDQRDFFNRVVAAKDMSNYYLLKKGEFAYNKSYSNGYDFGSIKRLNAYEQGCLSTLYICFALSSADVNSDYLECYFDTLQWYDDVSQICAEGARNHGLLNVDTKAFFDEVSINMPSSITEQKQISVVLNNFDNLITLHQRKCNETKELKKYMLQKMFPQEEQSAPDIRFAGFTDDWEQRKVIELGEIYIGLVTTMTSHYTDHGVLLIRNSDIKDGRFEFGDNPIYLDKDFARQNSSRKHKIGDVITVHTGDIGTSAVITEKEADSIGFATIVTRPYKDRITSDYLCAYLNTDRHKNFAMNISTGDGRNNYNLKDYYECIVPVPCIAEQMKIGEYIRSLNDLITLHQQKCDEMKELKKYMLQNMFPQKG